MNINNNTGTTKLSEGNKLRLLYSRRPCRDQYIPICAEPDPPNSDFPHNWGGYSDAMHVDFKVPSEHTIYGERFDGEMQIFHLHPGRKRTPAVSQVMRAADDPYSYNFMLQMVLDEFQAVYDDHQALCAQKIRRERRLVSMMHWLLGENVQSKFVDYTSWADFSTTRDDPNARELQSRFWYPHHEELVPSLYFYGYNGSLTEPPCGEWVTWYVTDTPMKVHIRQLEQLKRLIFTHVSPECEKTGVQFDESVARPIQDTFRRGVWRCTSDNFLPDAGKTRY
jgi:carbonic anhydrase